MVKKIIEKNFVGKIPLINPATNETVLSLSFYEEGKENKLYNCSISECKDSPLVDLLNKILFRANVCLVDSRNDPGCFRSVEKIEPFGSAKYWRAVVSQVYIGTNQHLLPEPYAFKRFFSKLLPGQIKPSKYRLIEREKAIFEELKQPCSQHKNHLAGYQNFCKEIR